MHYFCGLGVSNKEHKNGVTGNNALGAPGRSNHKTLLKGTSQPGWFRETSMQNQPYPADTCPLLGPRGLQDEAGFSVGVHSSSCTKVGTLLSSL